MTAGLGGRGKMPQGNGLGVTACDERNLGRLIVEV